MGNLGYFAHYNFYLVLTRVHLVEMPSNSPSKHSKPKVAWIQADFEGWDRIWSPCKQWGIPKKKLEVGRWQMIGSFGPHDPIKTIRSTWTFSRDFSFFFFWRGGGGDDLPAPRLNGDLGVTLWFASTVWVPYRVYVGDYPTHWIGYIGLFRVV